MRACTLAAIALLSVACGKQKDADPDKITSTFTCRYTLQKKGGPAEQQFQGTAKSKESEEAACQAASDDACRKAGARPGCEASGAYEKTGRETESVTGPGM